MCIDRLHLRNTIRGGRGDGPSQVDLFGSLPMF